MSMKIDYKKVLNPAQFDAVMTTEGPVLVIAGAGSGKTRTLVYRVARLVELGIPPEQILLLTFTRKAAQEMLDRAAELTDPRCRFVSGGTFHSLAHKVLRRHGELLGYGQNFTILDRSDMEEILQSLVAELNPVKSGPRIPKRATLANMLSKAANLERSVEEIIATEYPQFIDFGPIGMKLAHNYGDYKKKNQLMDYDDLLINMRTLLTSHAAVQEELSEQYRYIMVDEYQDTNTIQADIVKLLAVKHQNVMVVGDDCQSIYSFRGANYRNMFDFPKIFPGTKVIKLEENYRSTQPILTFTNTLMDRAEEKYTKCLFTRREGGQLPKLVDTLTEPEQALYVCRIIKQRLNAGFRLRDMAVLFRAGYHSFELELELVRQGIPFVKYGGFKFMESAHIKDFLAHIRVVMNRDDMVSWGRILRLIPNIGQAKSQAIIRWMKEKDVPPGQMGKWPGAGKAEKDIKKLAALLGTLENKDLSPKEGIQEVIEYYQPILQARYDDYPKRQKDLEQLIPMAGRYKKLRSFIDDLILEPPTSVVDLTPGQKTDSLTLSTVHSAKGLEWPIVFIIWVMEGRFPTARSYGDPMALEEERRLMYVATTRAKDELIMCYPSRESLPSWQMGGEFREGLSCFVQGIPGDVLSYELGRRPDQSPGQRVVTAKEQTDQFLCPGDRVKHPAFGAGVISKLIGDDKIEVFFRNAGKKLLHLAYTTLEKI